MKYIVGWDAGYGENYDVIEAESLEAAEKQAYEAWKDDAESNADYWAKEYTKEVAKEYDLE